MRNNIVLFIYFLCILVMLAGCYTTDSYRTGSPGSLSDAMEASRTGEDTDIIIEEEEEEEEEVVEQETAWEEYVREKRERDLMKKEKELDKKERDLQQREKDLERLAIIHSENSNADNTTSGTQEQDYYYTDNPEPEQENDQDEDSLCIGISWMTRDYLEPQMKEFFPFPHNIGFYCGGFFKSWFYARLEGAVDFSAVEKGGYLDQTLDYLTIAQVNIEARIYPKLKRKFLCPFVGSGLGAIWLTWDYENPILADYGDHQEWIDEDALSGYLAYATAGLELIYTKKFHFSVVGRVGACLFWGKTRESFDNDFFRNTGFTQIGLNMEAHF